MLATSGTGQGITTYSTLIGGPRQAGEADGPEEFHVVLVDNGRSQLLADAEQREVLHCIRCGACLNICPVFRHVGGHTYGTTYPGPIGSVLTPHLNGIAEFKALVVRIVVMRCLHQRLSGENRFASSPVAKSTECNRGRRFKTEQAAYVPWLASRHVASSNLRPR